MYFNIRMKGRTDSTRRRSAALKVFANDDFPYTGSRDSTLLDLQFNNLKEQERR